MKPVFFAILLFTTLILAGSSIQPVSSQSIVNVKVEASPSNPHVSEAFTVTISLANVQNLYGIEVILKWDASVLQATKIDARLGVESYADGVLHESTNTPQATQEPVTSPSSMPTREAPTNTIKPHAEAQWSDYALPLIAAIILSAVISGIVAYMLKRK